jgi:hypothetical protein
MKSLRFALLALLLPLLALAAPPPAPIPLNPAVTQATIDDTICVPGYTKTVRPPVSFTDKLKYKLMDAQGIPRKDAHLFELDHKEALTDGGAGSDPRNLQLQLMEHGPYILPNGKAWKGEVDAKVKDKVEVAVNKAICSKKMRLAEAQACLWNDWRKCSKTLSQIK